MKQKLAITYDTYRSWKYRRWIIDNQMILREIPFFEKAVTKLDRSGNFPSVAIAYHAYLIKHLDEVEYRCHLKQRQIESEDDYYNYLCAFYAFYFKEDGDQLYLRLESAAVKVREKKRKRFCDQDYHATPGMRQLILEASRKLKTTDTVKILRLIDQQLSERSDHAKKSFLKNNGIRTTYDWMNLIECVLES